MTKPTPKLTAKPKKMKLVAALLAVMLLTVGGVFLYKHHQKTQAIAKERSEYAQVDKDLESVAERVNNTVKPAGQKKNEYCDYTSQEFGRGERHCNVGYDLFYPVADINDARQLTGNIEAVFEAQNIIKFTNSLQQDPPVTLGSINYKLYGLNCSRNYVYQDSELLDKSVSSGGNSTHLLELDIDCASKNPLSEYYPLKQGTKPKL